MSKVRTGTKGTHGVRLLLAVTLIMLSVGCGKHYLVTRPLGEELVEPPFCYIEVIANQYADDVNPASQPTEAELGYLRQHLVEEMGVAGLAPADEADSAALIPYRLVGSVMEFDRPSATSDAVELITGFDTGKGWITVLLLLEESPSGRVLFSGRFKAKANRGFGSDDHAWGKLAGDFARELFQQRRKLRLKR